MRLIAAALSMVCAACSADRGTEPAGGGSEPAAPRGPVRIAAGLKAPESFVHDPQTGDYFISSVNGDPKSLDNNGFITRLGPDLTVRDEAFIAGGADGVELNGPKGMVVFRKTLYVADINTVRAFSLPDGKQAGSFSMVRMRVQFLNDVTVLNGMIYVTDTFDQKVYKLDPDLAGAELVCTLEAQPNGIVAVPGKEELLIATWGRGRLLTLAPDGTAATFYDGTEKKLENLDGIVFDPAGNIIVSSYTQGMIYRLTPAKELTTIERGLTSPADIGIDAQGRLLVPLMNADEAVVLPAAAEK